MGHSFVETDEPLKWNREGKSYSLNEAKRLINETCLGYIRKEYEDKDDDDWNYASLGDKEGVIVSYFPQLSNEELINLTKLVKRDRIRTLEQIEEWSIINGKWVKPYLMLEKGGEYYHYTRIVGRIYGLKVANRNPEYVELVKHYKKSQKLPTTKKIVARKAIITEDDKIPLTTPPKFGKIFQEVQSYIQRFKEAEKIEKPRTQYGRPGENWEEARAAGKAIESELNMNPLLNSQTNKDYRKMLELSGAILKKEKMMRQILAHKSGAWTESKLSLENLMKMRQIMDKSYGPALAIANDEIVWMGGFSREG